MCFAKTDMNDRKTLQKIMNNSEKKTHNINNNNNTDKKQTITSSWITTIKSQKKDKGLGLE